MLYNLIPNGSTFFVALMTFGLIGVVTIKIIRDKMHHKSSCGACSTCNICTSGQKNRVKIGKHKGLL